MTTDKPATTTPRDRLPENEGPPLLSVDALRTHIRTEQGTIHAVDGVSFSVDRGETVCLVGESGSGKSVTCTSLTGIVPQPPAEIVGGSVEFDGQSLLETDESTMRRIRGNRIAHVFQNPQHALDPVYTVGDQITEAISIHRDVSETAARERAIELLRQVGIPRPAERIDEYPHEFSGGEKQRISIARALVCNPDLIVADEPTSALDGRIQSDVLALLDDIRREFEVSILLISHDLDVVRRFCDRVAVMYLGEIVEKGLINEVLESPAHPYTRVLLDSVPSLDPADRGFARPLTDTIPDPSDPPSGCRFHTCCPELIPPSDVDLPREQWQAIAAFRFTLQTGELPEEVDADVGESSVDDATVRETFGLPETIPNERVDRGVSDAIEALARGNRQGAHNHLDGTIPSVCERDVPRDAVAGGRQVRCHRYDSEIEGEPRDWRA